MRASRDNNSSSSQTLMTTYMSEEKKKNYIESNILFTKTLLAIFLRWFYLNEDEGLIFNIFEKRENFDRTLKTKNIGWIYSFILPARSALIRIVQRIPTLFHACRLQLFASLLQCVLSISEGFVVRRTVKAKTYELKSKNIRSFTF